MLQAVVGDPVAREASVRRMLEITHGLAWEVQAPRYVDLVERLARGR